MNGIRYGLVLFYVAVFGVNALQAQRDSLPAINPDTLDLEVVTVEALRLPQSARHAALTISVLGAEQLQSGQAQRSLQEVLGYVPGVLVLNPDNYAQDLRIAIRGFGARAAFGIRGIKLLVDGLPETTPDGQAQVDNLDLGLVDQLTVIRGAASGLYGNAAGGVISLRTREMGSDTSFTELCVLAGAYGLQKYQLQGGRRWGRWQAVAFGSHFRSSGYRAWSNTRSTLMNGKLRYQGPAGGKLTFLLNYVDSPQANDPGALTIAAVTENPRQAFSRNVQFRAGEALSQGRVGVVWEKPLGANGYFSSRAFTLRRAFENSLPFAAGGIVTLERAFHGLGWNYRWGRGSWRLAVGQDAEAQRDQRRRYDNNEGERGTLGLQQLETFSTLGSYVLSTWSSSTIALEVTAGGRLDALWLGAADAFLTDGDDSGRQRYLRVNPLIGISYGISAQGRIYANITSSFEAPALTELGANPTNAGGFNTELVPQQAWNLEAGFKGSIGAQLQVELAAFQIEVARELVPYELEAFPGRTFYRNAGSSRRSGIETAVVYKPHPRWTFQGSASYTAFVYREYRLGNTDFAGNNLPGLPRLLLQGELRYRTPWGLYTALQTRYLGQLYADDTNETVQDGYWLGQVRAGWVIIRRSWQLEPFAGWNNLGNTDYPANVRINAFGGRYWEPAPPGNGYLGLRLSW